MSTENCIDEPDKLFELTQLMNSLKLGTLRIRTEQMYRHPDQRKIRQENVEYLIKKFKSDGIRQSDDINLMSGFIDGVTTIDQFKEASDGDWLKPDYKYCVLSGGHRLEAITQLAKRNEDSELLWWTGMILSDGMIPDDCELV